MKILNFTLLITICVCLSNSLFSQDRFIKAHIIDKNQQRIDGSIDFGNPIQNPDKIIFLDSSTLRISIYEPLDIQFFAIEKPYERRYESRIIQITDYSKYVEGLKESETLPIITDTVFVEVLVKGNASLYQYKDEKKWVHFFAEKDDEFQTLVQKIIKYDKIDINIIVLTQRYKSQLRTLFSDCPNIIESINALENTAASLSDIFTTYNIYSGNENEFTKDTKNKSRGNQKQIFAINLGYRYSTLFLSNVKIYDMSYIENINFDISKGIPIGLSFDVPISKKNNRLSLYNELLFVRFTSFSEVWETSGRTEQIGFLFRYLRYSAALRYRLGKEDARVSPFVNIGGNLSYAFTASSNVAINYAPAFSVLRYRTFLINPRSLPIGLIAGFGAKKNRLSAELRMEYTNGLSLNYAMKTSILSTYLMFTYSLGQ
ncbi:MAG: hypothetical protein ACJAUH_002532 [Saprospiraceae bacterium]|jgi:hypothetical protein